MGPRGSWCGIQEVPQERISSCRWPGARAAMGAQDFLLPPVLGVVSAVRAGHCTLLVLNKYWLVVRQVCR